MPSPMTTSGSAICQEVIAHAVPVGLPDVEQHARRPSAARPPAAPCGRTGAPASVRRSRPRTRRRSRTGYRSVPARSALQPRPICMYSVQTRKKMPRPTPKVGLDGDARREALHPEQRQLDQRRTVLARLRPLVQPPAPRRRGRCRPSTRTPTAASPARARGSAGRAASAAPASPARRRPGRVGAPSGPWTRVMNFRPRTSPAMPTGRLIRKIGRHSRPERGSTR